MTGEGVGLFATGEFAACIEDAGDNDLAVLHFESDARPAFKADNPKSRLNLIPHSATFGK